MKILYHHRTRAEDAQGVHINSLCQAFMRLGHKVNVVGPVKSGNKYADKENNKDAGNRPTVVMGFAVPQWLYELLALGYNVYGFMILCLSIQRDRPDLIYERYAIFNVAGRLASGVYKIPFVLEVNAPLSLEMQKYGQLKLCGLARKIEDWLCSSSTKTVVVSDKLREIIEKRGVPHKQFLVIHNGVDRKIFNPQIDGMQIRSELGLSDYFVVGFVGWMRSWHGIDLLIEAANILHDEIPGLRVLLVGDGPAVKQLTEQVNKLKLEEKVIFTGSVSRKQVPKYIAAMDVAIQPNVTEYASPIKLFEYVALAKAVIAPRQDNIREVVEDGQNAILFTPGNSSEIADCIRKLNANRSLMQEISKNAGCLINDKGYYWEENACRVLDAIGLG